MKEKNFVYIIMNIPIQIKNIHTDIYTVMYMSLIKHDIFTKQ